MQQHIRPMPTLPGRDYVSRDVYARERENVFARGWVCVGREEQLEHPGDFLTRELLDEPVLVMRGGDGTVRAFANSCRHRGTRLLDGAGNVRSAIRCPYHAWSYAFDGRFLGAPNVHEEDGLRADELSLWEIALAIHDGFVFVNVSGDAPPFRRTLETMDGSPLELERYDVGSLRVGASRTYDVAANWKIVVENYHECLHCPTVHPELVKLIPLYRRGEVEEDGQTIGNTMGHGLTSFTMTGLSSLPSLPRLTDEDVHMFYGVYLFPNVIVNYHSETVNAVTMYPEGPERTTVVSEFLFRPETIGEPGFDPSEVVDFRDMVAKQDWVVCELAQRGVRSRFYDHGVYPRHEKYLYAFNQAYLTARDG